MHRPPNELECLATVTPDATTLTVRGSLAGASGARALASGMRRVGVAPVLSVDVSAVTFLGQRAHDVLLRRARRLVARGRQLVVVCSDVMLHHELALTDLGRIATLARDAGSTLSQPRQAA